MTKPGFSLLEVLIAVMLAAVISMALYSSFFQTQKTVQRANAAIDIHTELIAFYNQLEKDMSTAYVPLGAPPFDKKAQEKKKHDKKTEEQSKQTEPEKKPEDTPPIEPVEQIFYTEQKDQNSFLMTWITTNSLQSYGVTLPRAMRVVYRLIPSKQNPELFTLARQESSNFSLKSFDSLTSAPRSYDILDRIQKLSLKFWIEEPAPEQEETKKQKKSPSKKEYVAVSPSWGSLDQIERYKKYLPAFVEVAGTVFDAQMKRAHEFAWLFKIYAYEAQSLPLPEASSKEKQQAPGIKGEISAPSEKKIATNEGQKIS
jgi:prepilin-type N-terminal cleavage/methylation domain-containing protein